MQDQVRTLEQLLDHLAEAAATRKRVSLATVVEVVGQRSFGAVLTVVGLLLVSPLSGIIGMATTSSIVVTLIAIQLLLDREYIWLPRWLMRRSTRSVHALRAIATLRRPAQFMDRWVKPRLPILTRRLGTCLVALMCICVASIMPFMELIPFSATVAGVPLTMLGLALFAKDGVLVIVSATLVGLFFLAVRYVFF